MVLGCRTRHWNLLVYMVKLLEKALSFVTYRFPNNSLAWLGVSTAQRRFPVGILDAATLFWRQGEFNGIDAICFMPVGLSASEWSEVLLIYQQRQSFICQ